MEFLSRCLRPQRSSSQRTKLERSANHLAACLQQGRKNVHVVELGTTVDEVTDPGGSTTDSKVVASRRRENSNVGVCQAIHSLRRHWAGKDDKASLLQLRGCWFRERVPCGASARPVGHKIVVSAVSLKKLS